METQGTSRQHAVPPLPIKSYIYPSLQTTKVWYTSMWCPCIGLFPQQPMLGTAISLLTLTWRWVLQACVCMCIFLIVLPQFTTLFTFLHRTCTCIHGAEDVFLASYDVWHCELWVHHCQCGCKPGKCRLHPGTLPGKTDGHQVLHERPMPGILVERPSGQVSVQQVDMASELLITLYKWFCVCVCVRACVCACMCAHFSITAATMIIFGKETKVSVLDRCFRGCQCLFRQKYP